MLRPWNMSEVTYTLSRLPWAYFDIGKVRKQAAELKPKINDLTRELRRREFSFGYSQNEHMMESTDEGRAIRKLRNELNEVADELQRLEDAERFYVRFASGDTGPGIIADETPMFLARDAAAKRKRQNV